MLLLVQRQTKFWFSNWNISVVLPFVGELLVSDADAAVTMFRLWLGLQLETNRLDIGISM